MKTRMCLLCFALALVPNAFTQIILNGADFPSTTGMVFITEDDTSASLPVNVGSPGENQVWALDHSFPCIHSIQKIVDVSTTPYYLFFSESNLVTQYQGCLGSQINSYYFNDIAGTFYTYQEKQLNSIVLKGIGVASGTFTGPIQFEPEILYFALPLEYGASWTAASTFTISIDTSFFGIPATLVAKIQNSLVSVVDGWGTIKLPVATFNCVRVKSYITLDEKLYLSGDLFKEHESGTINYFWVAEAYGVVAKVISQLDEQNDNFTNAAQISRLQSFSSSSGIAQEKSQPRYFRLHPNFPNPFNTTTTIPFDMNRSGHVKIEVFNMLGQRIKTLSDNFYSTGKQQIQWNSTNSVHEMVPSGVYFIKMSSNNLNASAIQKIILMR